MNRISSSAGASQHTTAGPYSPVLTVSAGDLIVLSGQGPLDDAGRLVGEGIREQTRATLENCRRQLQTAGADLSDVFKVTAYLADLADWESFNDEYRRHFPGLLPVRTAVGAQLLLGMRVELDVWAVR